jgi:hypothetical protein
VTTTNLIPQQSARQDAFATTDDIQAGRVTGVGYAVSVASGKPIPVYVSDTPPPQSAPTPPTVPAAQPQQVIVQQQPRDPWPARILASGGTIAGVAATVGHFATELGQAAHAGEAIGIGVGAAAAGLWLLKGSSPRVSVTINNSNTGASSSSSSTSSSSSASGWRSHSSS